MNHSSAVLAQEEQQKQQQQQKQQDLLREKFPKTSAFLEESFSRLLAIATSENNNEEKEGWKFYAEKDGINIYRGHDGATLGIGKIRATPERIAQVLLCPDMNMSRRRDPQCTKLELIHNFKDDGSYDNAVFLCQFASPSRLVAERDFVFLRDVKRLSDGTVAVNSVTLLPEEAHNGPPPLNNGVVRGAWTIAGFVFKPISAEETLVHYAIQVDFKGYIPEFVTKFVVTENPLYIARLRKICEGDGGAAV